MNRHRVGKWFEICWPWAAASIASMVGFWFCDRAMMGPDVSAHLLDKLIDFCSIGVGFWATALALLLALESRQTVAGLKTLDVYSRIVGYFLTSVYAFFFLLLLCMGAIAVGRPHWLSHRLSVAIWASVLTFTGSSMLRSFHLLGKLLRSK